jgi:DNA-binding NarL/FixJ family response regulator
MEPSAPVAHAGAVRTIVVEDDPVMASRLADAIARADDLHLVGTAANFRDGAALVAAGGFDVLLCDLGLPDGSGIDLIAQASALHPNADILVITLFGDPAKVLDSIAAGARGYLLKDQRIEDCIAAIREIRRGGSPISPIIARQLLHRIAAPAAPATTTACQSLLSDREAEVLDMLARGFSYAETAGLLAVSAHTIGSHVKNIYRKLNVNNRSEAVYEAAQHGLLAPKRASPPQG